MNIVKKSNEQLKKDIKILEIGALTYAILNFVCLIGSIWYYFYNLNTFIIFISVYFMTLIFMIGYALMYEINLNRLEIRGRTIESVNLSLFANTPNPKKNKK